MTAVMVPMRVVTAVMMPAVVSMSVTIGRIIMRAWRVIHSRRRENHWGRTILRLHINARWRQHRSDVRDDHSRNR
jgi:hypothetical protein